MLQSMKKLGGPKKPAPKATPDQIKMAKRLKEIQSKQRNSPEGQEFRQLMLSKNKEVSDEIKRAAADRKERSEANIDAMGRQATQRIEDKFGEEEFGPNYKDLNLQPYRYRQISGGKEQVKRGYTVKTDDPNPAIREEVEKVNPNQDILRVYRTSKREFDRQMEPEYGISIKDKQGFNPRTGERATVYEESIKQRAEKNRAAYKARIKAIADKGEAEAKRMIAEEAAKAKAKADGNK